MKILFPVSEVASIYKVGGLGDVAAALPKALTELGHDVRIVLPKHPEIVLDAHEWKQEARFQVVYNSKPRLVTVWAGWLPETNVKVYLFSESTILSTHSDAGDTDVDKFALFSLAVSHWVARIADYWHPHLIHLHDWHVSLIPVILKYKYGVRHVPSLLTIHNLRFQGTTTRSILEKLDIPTDHCQILQWDQSNGDVDILMEGILHADYINTVSPTYAKEILTLEYGAGLEMILGARQGRLTGILNGIDTEVWDPKTDEFIIQKYTKKSWREGKSTNKIAIQKRLNLPREPRTPLIAFVGRLDKAQKGLDLIIQALKEGGINTFENQVVLLGTGDTDLEEALQVLGDEIKGFTPIIKFDEELAHLLYAAADIMLIPSRYEPCGLVQLIAMKYGTIPVVRQTGGLADTVVNGETGFVFEDYSAAAMKTSIDQALQILNNKEKHEALVESMMKADYSWEQSAHQYVSLYNTILNL